jgi:HK97 family phage major capsid protein
MAASPKLRAEFKSAFAEAEALRLNDDRNEDQTARYKAILQETLPTLKAKIDEADALDSVNLDAYRDLTNKSVGTPYSSSTRSAGFTTISDSGEVQDDGLGILTDKQNKSISTPEYARAFKAFLHFGEDKLKNSYSRTYKTLVEGIDEGAGYFVPPDILNEIIQRKPAPTTLRGRVRQITTNSNRVVMLRTTFRDDIYTSPIQGMWTGEAGTPSASLEPTFGEVSIPVHEYMGRISMSNTMLEDSGFNLEQYFNQELQTWMDLHYEKHLAYGTGVGQPRGIWNSISSSAGGEAGKFGFVATTGASIDADTVKSMGFSILPQYAQPGFNFVMNQQTAKAISLLKASTGTLNNGAYLFQRGQVYPGIVERTPDQIDGFPITYSMFAPAVATGAFPVFFGSLQGVFMPIRMGLSVRVLNEIEAVNNRRVYLFRLRWGADTIQEQYGKFIKVS